ncbi:MAG: hypothetical protein V4526_01150 [Patescibacteria group bacterium]
MANKRKKYGLLPVTAIIVIISGIGWAIYIPAEAATYTYQTNWKPAKSLHVPHMPAVFGKVTDIDGSKLKVLGREGVRAADEKTYTIDASDAVIFKGSVKTKVGVSDIKEGDTVIVRGEINGTSVEATKIFDGNIVDKSNLKGKRGFRKSLRLHRD